jgi:outer membrane immunogenic protein
MRKCLIELAASAALITTPALAADIPVKAPLPEPAPVYSWTGLYVGFNSGYGWGGSTVAFTPNDVLANDVTCGGAFGSGGTCPPPASVGIKGAFGGLQVGYNWQLNQVALVGVEADLDGAGISGSGTSTFPMFAATPPGISSFTTQQEVTSLGTVRGRLGWLASNPLLLYATGGFAYGHINDNVALNVNPGIGGATTGGFGFSCTVPGTNCFFGNESHVVTGWTAGAGLEYALGNNVSLKAEYLYVSMGGEAVNVSANRATLNPALIPSSFTAAFNRTDFQVVRAGLNIRLGGPMPAKY